MKFEHMAMAAWTAIQNIIIGIAIGLYGGYLFFEFMHPSLGYAKDFVYCVGSQMP